MGINPSIQKLAQLMQVRQEQKESPYVLLLGSSLSLTSSVRRAFAGTEDWEAFWKAMQRTSPTERKALLKKPLDALGLEPGYQAVARLAEAGYFHLVLTLNVDDAIDDAVRPLPADQSVLLIYDGSNSPRIVATLSRATPRLKVVKLRGDINAQALPLTDTGQFEFPNDLECSVAEWLRSDMILFGDIPYDTDVQRCIKRSTGALWCILPDEPAPDSFIRRAKRSRPSGDIITGAVAEFNAFFTALAEKVLEEKVEEGDRVEIYERSTISLAVRLLSHEQLLGDSDYGEIAEEIAEEMKEPDERLLSSEQPRPLGDSEYREIAEEIAEEMKESDERPLSSEQPSPLGDSDYREIAEEITEEMKEPDERLLSSEQPSPLGDSEYRESADEIAEETKEPDERLPNSPRSNSQAARSSVIKEWLIARSSGVLDEIIAGLIMAGILGLFGVVSGVLEGAPVAWLANSRSTWYLVVSIALIGVALITYVAWQRKRR